MEPRQRSSERFLQGKWSWKAPLWAVHEFSPWVQPKTVTENPSGNHSHYGWYSKVKGRVTRWEDPNSGNEADSCHFPFSLISKMLILSPWSRLMSWNISTCIFFYLSLTTELHLLCQDFGIMCTIDKHFWKYLYFQIFRVWNNNFGFIKWSWIFISSTRRSKRAPEKHLFLLYWLWKSLQLCRSQ